MVLRFNRLCKKSCHCPCSEWNWELWKILIFTARMSKHKEIVLKGHCLHCSIFFSWTGIMLRWILQKGASIIIKTNKYIPHMCLFYHLKEICIGNKTSAEPNGLYGWFPLGKIFEAQVKYPLSGMIRTRNILKWDFS